MPTSYQCEICGQPVLDYVPSFCCDGHECSCQGRPTEPCTCSATCENALFRGIGKTMEERRLDANILPNDFRSEFHTWLSLAGFTTRDPSADFGDKLVGTSYFYRERANAYEYVLLSFYRDQFCEGVYWVYASPRNERLKTNNTFDAVKRGGAPVSVSFFRDLPDLINLELTDDNLSHFIATTIQSLAQACKRK